MKSDRIAILGPVRVCVLTFFAAVLACVLVKADEPSRDADGPLVLAHYMPWYSAKPASDHWGWHWTMNHFDPESKVGDRREIASKYYPIIGPYDSGDPNVLEYHLLLMKSAGIDGVIVDWYGLTDLNDYALLHENTQRLISQVDRLGMKFAICYEDQTLPKLIKADRVATEDRVSHVVSEIDWMANDWFTKPSYVKLAGRPVLLSFGNAGLTNAEWTRAIGELQDPVAYFSEHICRDGAVGGFDWPVPADGVERTARFVDESRQWQSSIPVVFPRFVDIYGEAKVRDSYPLIADDNGATFRTTLQRAMASHAPIVQVATWNDWGEGTSIEPSEEFGYRDLEVLQQARLDRKDSKFMARPEDLRLPLALLRLRRQGTHPEGKLSTVARTIAGSRFSLARRQIEYLSSKEPIAD